MPGSLPRDAGLIESSTAAQSSSRRLSREGKRPSPFPMRVPLRRRIGTSC